jgi:recombination DNA repair RAD52 pathway protein
MITEQQQGSISENPPGGFSKSERNLIQDSLNLKLGPEYVSFRIGMGNSKYEVVPLLIIEKHDSTRNVFKPKFRISKVGE